MAFPDLWQRGDLGVKPLVKTCKCKLNRQSYAATWGIRTKKRFPFGQITLVFVVVAAGGDDGECI